jgi:hypothetical protein
VALRVLRGGRDALATLLEAVLADPLVQWGGEREAAAARRSLDVAVALNLLVSRCVRRALAGACCRGGALVAPWGWGGALGT